MGLRVVKINTQYSPSSIKKVSQADHKCIFLENVEKATCGIA